VYDAVWQQPAEWQVVACVAAFSCKDQKEGVLDDDHENNCSNKSCRSCICSHIFIHFSQRFDIGIGFENILNRARADEAGSGSAALLRAAAAAALKELAEAGVAASGWPVAHADLP
jgi:hypothetical protein